MSIVFSQPVKQLGKLRWQRRFEFQILAASRMTEAEHPGVKRLAVDGERFFRPVLRVASERIADVFHMDANLVRPPRFQLALHIRVMAKPLEHAEMGDGFLAVFLGDGHFFRSRLSRPIGASIVP